MLELLILSLLSNLGLGIWVYKVKNPPKKATKAKKVVRKKSFKK